MAKYVRQNRPVECSQWHPTDNPSPYATQPDGYGVYMVEGRFGPVSIHPGDWIIEHPDGAVEVLSDGAFRTWYVGAGTNEIGKPTGTEGGSDVEPR